MTRKRREQRARETQRSPFGPVAASIVAVALILPVFLWGNPYPAQLMPYWTFGALAVVLVTTALFLWYDDVVEPVVARVARLSPIAFMLIAGATTTLICMALAIYAFHRFATTSDEIAQLWHARMLLHGRLSLPVDPNREFFSLDTVVDSGRWYSQFPIGGPITLALGALIGAPWIINPLFAGGSTIAVYQFTRRAFDEGQARLAAALFITTPMMLFLAGTWMNHVPVMFFAIVALVALTTWDSSLETPVAHRAGAVIGACVGAIATIRPLDAIVVAMVVGVFQLWRLRSAPTRWTTLITEVVAGSCFIAFLLYANWHTSGSALRFGYDVAWGPGHRVGFHTDPYGNAHTIGRGLDYALSYFSELNINLTMWPVPVLLFLLAGLWAMRRPTRWDVVLLAFVATQTLAYGAYWYRGELLGPRFLYPVIPALMILLARTPALVGQYRGERAKYLIASIILACVVVSWATPVSEVGPRGVAYQVNRQRKSLKVDIAGTVRDANVHHAVVFIREPFSLRLARRLWALGIARASVAQFVQSRDACVLLTAIESAERDTSSTPAQRMIAVASVPTVANPLGAVATDPAIHVQSRESLTPECEAEINGDAGQSPIPFGAALVLEPIGSNGQIDGDVIYLADLGAHNEVLRRRFGDRGWYRLRLASRDGEMKPVLERY